MRVNELSAAECWEVLSRTHVGRLACARADQPYVVPISFSYDVLANCIFSFSAVGKKVDWMRENPKVCVEVEEVADRYNWTTIVVFGRYDEIGDTPDERGVRARALKLFEERSRWWFPAVAKIGSEERPAVVVYRIHVETVSGRRTEQTDT
jgi:nitroimidazol reductase NimA-like FMN-containing flavoprotein (pyridoxamine 5'-phosphate oxidase superfamily)